MTSIIVTVLAHNEERRIGACLMSLLREPGDFPIHVVVNGSRDRTAEIARGVGPRIIVHAYQTGGKSRSWNRFVFDDLAAFADVHIFADGDTEIVPGSIAALKQALTDDANSHANAAAGQPCNGRNMTYYRTEQLKTHGLFGDLYALRGSFLASMKCAKISLPDDLIGDDSLIGALAKTNLENEDHWQDARLIVCPMAGFTCEPARYTQPRSWVMQYRRLINYSVRYFQNQIVSSIMRSTGPKGLPRDLAELYPQWLPKLQARRTLRHWWFDRCALQRMRRAIPS